MQSVDLVKRLEENPRFFSRFVTLREFVDQILANQIPAVLQAVETPTDFFTDHGTQHLQRVISKLNALVSLLPTELDDKEVFLLLVGAYCHDLGMFLGGHQNESPQEIRLHHHERSAELIDVLVTGHYINLDTFEITVAKIIARAHRSVDIDEVPAEHNAEQSVIRTRLLSALLRIADACDLDHTRAPEAVFNFLFDNIPQSSRQHWRQHQIVAGVQFNRLTAAIVVSVQLDGGFVERIDKLRIANSISKELERELQSVSRVFASNGIGLAWIETKDFDTNEAVDFSSVQLGDDYFLLGLQSGIDSVQPLYDAVSSCLTTDQGPTLVVEITPPEGPLLIDTGQKVHPSHIADFENQSKPLIVYFRNVKTPKENVGP